MISSDESSEESEEISNITDASVDNSDFHHQRCEDDTQTDEDESNDSDTEDDAIPKDVILNPKIGNYVVVSVENNRKNKFFVGVVIAVDQIEKLYKISFLKGTKGGKFIFPLNEDHSYVSLSDINFILKEPNVDRRENYSFNENEINKFNI